ncbi:hypothetical protein CLQ_14523 (plasmid) [Clostridium botulinum Af84]|uniref:hypothetical protein n=1 Tax=Clostridium botulinum TaxID=1491 RepID=UPI00035BAC05|nr:hypothetical protein [Clostridium botulinum]APR02632.1 hypothetical protein RSJ2_3772 [Clostridium botulinum]AUN19819.1 hypothetical protein B2M06_19945 [Clostridium botulinum]EPS54510.1 hypothetical protein CLQ_14523 [Clostridium botulinum Af84]NFE18644.1 hypothetical protein [Clostridium botulinum]NFM84399.1 hypothetical protein [Clostridium botulinum]
MNMELKEKKEKNIDSIVELVFLPNTIDSVKKFQDNIKAYGYLENMFGFFHAIKNPAYKEVLDTMKNIISKNNLKDLISLHQELMGYTKSEEEAAIANTLFMCIMHQANKDLGLYNLD